MFKLVVFTGLKFTSGIPIAKTQVTVDLKIAKYMDCRTPSLNSQCQLTCPVQAISRNVPVSS